MNPTLFFDEIKQKVVLSASDKTEIRKIIEKLNNMNESIPVDERISYKSDLAAGLVRFEDEFSRSILLELTYDESYLVRAEACDSLCVFCDNEVFDRLVELSISDKYLVRSYAVMSAADITKSKGTGIDKSLCIFQAGYSKEKSVHVKVAYCYAFCLLGQSEYLYKLFDALDNRKPYIKSFALSALVEVTNADNYNVVVKHLNKCINAEKDIAFRGLLSKTVEKLSQTQGDS